MRKCLLLFIIASCWQVGFAQFTDNFTDEKSENGAQLKTGMYIVFMQVFSEDGEVESYKKVVVLHN